MSFKVGDKVVCIDDTDQKPGAPERVVLNEIYTISDIRTGFGHVWVLLVGFKVMAFYIKCFRKVDEKFSDGLISELEEKINQENLVPCQA